MKNISLPNKELRLLSGQLQNFQAGYTVEQIRLLDRVVSNMNLVLNPFIMGGNELAKKIKEKNGEENMKKYMDEEGDKLVNMIFHDPDFEFLKLIWSKMSSLSGQPEARKSIIIIDDAIKAVTEPVFKEGD